MSTYGGKDLVGVVIITFDARWRDRHAASFQQLTQDLAETNRQGSQNWWQRVWDIERSLHQVCWVRRTGTLDAKLLNTWRDVVDVLLEMFGDRISTHVVSIFPPTPLDSGFLYSVQAT